MMLTEMSKLIRENLSRNDWETGVGWQWRVKYQQCYMYGVKQNYMETEAYLFHAREMECCTYANALHILDGNNKVYGVKMVRYIPFNTSKIREVAPTWSLANSDDYKLIDAWYESEKERQSIDSCTGTIDSTHAATVKRKRTL